MKKYVGITLGPIHDALMQATKPAGLWLASYMFSKMAYDICSELICQGVRQEQFIVPYFEVADHKVVLPVEADADMEQLRNQGLGFFHDRIIYLMNTGKEQSEEIRFVQSLIDRVTARYCDYILNLFPGAENRPNLEKKLQHSFQIYSLIREVEEDASPVLAVSAALDQLEMQNRFSVITDQDILFRLFSDNEKIKASAFVKQLEGQWQVSCKNAENRESIKDIPHIAAAHIREEESGLKKYRYFAVVQADGDRMGKTLACMKTQEEIRAYSRKCLRYAALCSKKILEFGGVVIYAGGDDLLFLSPLESCSLENGKQNLLELIEELKGIFKACNFTEGIKEEIEQPALSVGVSIQYKSFPLYEALKKAEEMLFSVAKDQRDSLAVNVNKGSGQGMQFVIHEFMNSTIPCEIGKLADAGIENTYQTGVIKHLGDFSVLFHMAVSDENSHRRESLHHVFANVFDSSFHDNEQTRKALEAYENLLLKITEENNCGVVQKELLSGHSQNLTAYIQLLHYVRLFSEKAGEQE